jgi:hypothetical protein
MITAHPIATSLTSIPGKSNLDLYSLDISPITYDMCLDIGRQYLIVGFATRRGVAWVYAFPEDDFLSLSCYPAALFSFETFDVALEWTVDKTESGDHSWSIAALSPITDWFERFVGGDEESEKILASIVRKGAKRTPG